MLLWHPPAEPMVRDFDKDCLAGLQNFLDSYKVRTRAPAELPTLMEIARFPHWENVYSNILAFFLDTDQPHGFGSLFLRSIMAAYRHRCRDASWLADIPAQTVEATDGVEREVTTDTNKRIDILIDCAEARVCIENKIWSDLHNDLGDYRHHCEKDSDGRPVLGIVLSPHGVESQELECHRFVNVTYHDLVRQLRQHMGSYVGPYNTQYQYLLFDFLEQASRFSRTASMNDDEKAFLNFWRNNDQKISNIQEQVERMWEILDANSMAKAHRDQCEEQLSVPERGVFRTWIYRKSIAVFDLEDRAAIDGCRVFLDVQFHPLRIAHVLGKRSGAGQGELTELGRKIDANCGTEFKASADRLRLVSEESSFEDSARKKAVKTSISILKYLASRRLAETNAQ